jgi:hypothetical protein
MWSAIAPTICNTTETFPLGHISTGAVFFISLMTVIRICNHSIHQHAGFSVASLLLDGKKDLAGLFTTLSPALSTAPHT